MYLNGNFFTVNHVNQKPLNQVSINLDSIFNLFADVKDKLQKISIDFIKSSINASILPKGMIVIGKKYIAKTHFAIMAMFYYS